MNKRRTKPVETDEYNWSTIIAAVIVVLITIAFFIAWRRRKTTKKRILFAGPSESGKTVLFGKLITENLVKTQTSLKENIGQIDVKDEPIEIVDLPGHAAIRYEYFEKFKKSYVALVFVIDSASSGTDLRDAAEYLYTLLADETTHRQMEILIWCNKQDHDFAKTSDAIKALLEKEINLLRFTKTKQLAGTDSSKLFVGRPDRDFEFSHLLAKVQFAEGSLWNITEFESWLKKLV